MAKYTASITVDGTVQVMRVRKPVGLDLWQGTVSIFGTFGSGTVTLQASPDSGTTKITLKDLTGTTYSATTNDMVGIELGTGATNSDAMILYAVMTGSTNPTVTVAVDDNL